MSLSDVRRSYLHAIGCAARSNSYAPCLDVRYPWYNGLNTLECRSCDNRYASMHRKRGGSTARQVFPNRYDRNRKTERFFPFEYV